MNRDEFIRAFESNLGYPNIFNDGIDQFTVDDCLNEYVRIMANDNQDCSVAVLREDYALFVKWLYYRGVKEGWIKYD